MDDIVIIKTTDSPLNILFHMADSTIKTWTYRVKENFYADQDKIIMTMARMQLRQEQGII